MWFDETTAMLIGAIGGSGFGCWGGILGFLANRFASKGKHRAFMMNAIRFTIGAGLVLLAFGLAALFSGQPYHVWYPLLLLGGIVTGVLFPCYFQVRRQYNETELKNMRLKDMK